VTLTKTLSATNCSGLSTVLFLGAPFSLPLKTVKDSIEGIVKL
jgi:hypothetical protein